MSCTTKRHLSAFSISSPFFSESAKLISHTLGKSCWTRVLQSLNDISIDIFQMPSQKALTDMGFMPLHRPSRSFFKESCVCNAATLQAERGLLKQEYVQQCPMRATVWQEAHFMTHNYCMFTMLMSHCHVQEPWPLNDTKWELKSGKNIIVQILVLPGGVAVLSLCYVNWRGSYHIQQKFSPCEV